jgi:glycosyltransferase involved in cell wall biosynthesis
MTIDVSLIIPSLNEEKNISKTISNCLNALDSLNIKGELICVNDGSTDNTESLIKSMLNSDKRVRLLNHNKPKGFGASFWHGVEVANGNAVTIIPGDNENDPWETLRYLNLIKEVDIIIPFVHNPYIRSFFRRLLSFLFLSIINNTFRTRLNYTNGTVIYKLSVLKQLQYQSSGFFFQTDILIRLIKSGYMFAEVPYRLGMREESVSKAISFPSLMNVIKGYIKLVIDHYIKKDDKDVIRSSTTSKRSKKNKFYN